MRTRDEKADECGSDELKQALAPDNNCVINKVLSLEWS